MVRSGVDSKQATDNTCIASIEALISYSLKLLESAEASDNATSKMFMCLEQKCIDYEARCQSLREEKDKLLAEKNSIYDALMRMEENNRSLSEEAQRLQRQLEVIREIIRDNDIDEVKQRLAQIEDCSRVRLATPKRTNGRTEHSAGSLLDSDNTSSCGSDRGRPKRSRGSSGRKVSQSGDALRRSARLSAKRQGVSFLGYDSSNVAPNVVATAPPPTRKRSSSDSVDSYHDISFKRSLLINEADRLPGVLTDSDVTNDTTAEFTTNIAVPIDATKFRTPKRPMVTGNRLTRLHQFSSISSLRLQMCSCCGRRFAFGKPALRCKICRLVVHQNCQGQLKQRCVPPTDMPLSPCGAPETPRTPLSATLSRRHLGGPSNASPTVFGTPSSTLKRRAFVWHSVSIASLCPPNEFPQIPAPVIHCVNEVAARGLLQVGIYRVPGAEKRVFELLEKFMYGRTTPSLALVEDINVVCSCLKAFLRLLDEPLVTYALRPEFVAASESALRNPEGAKYEVATLFDKLPIANRDTLAFLLLHLKAVSRSSACRMGEANLAKVFGFTIIGHSCPEPPLTQAANEVTGQQAAVRLLLSVPDVVYSTILA
uniref:Rac GTPase-activating protein 1 n=1 Tax=Mesocestoides corti TaxID=53468 RepID=A0A5K3FKM5_MESCO